MSKNIQEAFQEFYQAYLEMLRENESLKSQLEILKGNFDLDECLHDEQIIMYGEDSTINSITERLMEKLNISKTKKGKEALLVLSLDNSGSMGDWEKFVARSLFIWIEKVLEHKYDNVKVEYIVHTTIAEKTTKDEFYKHNLSGGTIVSSGFREINLAVEDFNSLGDKDTYVFYLSDGDNLTSDNPKTRKLVERISSKVDMFTYFEINPYNRRSTIKSVFEGVFDVDTYTIKHKSDVTNILRKVLPNLD